MTPITDFITRWKAIVAHKDLAGLQAILAEDVTFYSPAVFKPYQGRVAATLLLANIIEVFGPLIYTHIYTEADGAGVVMQFETSIDAPDRKLMIEGVDIFQLSDAGQVQEMHVMLRPLSALQAVAAAMQARLMRTQS